MSTPPRTSDREGAPLNGTAPGTAPLPTPAAPGAPIVYVAANLPGRSQTFVYQEILALRAEGARIIPVTVRRNPFMTDLDAQLGGVDGLVGLGLWRDAALGAARSPRRLAGVVRDLARGPFPRRSQAARTAFHVVLGLALATRVRRWDAGYVHAHHAEISTTVALVAGRMTGVPFGFTAHGSDVHTYPLLLSQKIGSAEVVVAANDFVRGLLAEASPRADVHVVRCPVPLDRFRSAPRAPHDGPLRLLHVGRLLEVKDQETLIEAVAVARDGGTDVDLRIVGDGPRRADLERLVAERGLGDRVALLGAIQNDALPPLYAWADAFVMSSRREGMPIVLVEALAAGLPVAATDVGGISELVRDGVEGFLAPPADPGALAAAITRLADRSTREEMAARGAERARMHDLPEVAHALLDLFPVDVPGPAEAAPLSAGIDPAPGTAPPVGGPLAVTAVVRARRGGEALRRSLASVAAQRPRLPGEVIVTGPDAAGIREVADEAGVQTLLRADGATVAADAALAASQPWVAFLDEGDEWLPHHLAALGERRSGRIAVRGDWVGADGPQPMGAVLVQREALIAAAADGGGDASTWSRLREAGPVGECDIAVTRLAATTAPAGSLSPRRALGSRRRGRIAADGGPSVALMPSAAPLRAEAERLMAGRPVEDLSGTPRPLLRLLRRPPAMAFVGSARDAVLVRALGVRPLWPDRGESQTRSSRTRPAVEVAPGRAEP